MKTKTILFIVISFLFSGFGFAQEMNKSLLPSFSKSDLIKLLSEADKQELKKADDIDKKAKTEKSKSETTLKKAAGYQVKGAKKNRFKKKALKTRKKGLKQMEEVSKKYSQAMQIRYEVYSKNLSKVSEEGNPANNKFASMSLNRSAQYLDEAKNLRASVANTSDDEELDIQLSDAKSFEENALESLLETYAIYKATDNLEVIPVEEEIIEETPKNTETAASLNIIFQVQILALNEGPLTDEELKAMFNIDDYIWRKEEYGWYKYRIGRFSTAMDAIDYCEKMKTEYQIEDAFVLALKDGERITVAEAKELIGEE